MGPISNYRLLITTLSWDKEKMCSERWYIFLMMNSGYLTEAGTHIMSNLPYLDDRTGDVTFFMPGFDVSNGKKLQYLSFDSEGFIETVEWLERGCRSYKYSEDLDLVIIRYRPNSENIEQNFDLENLIAYNLDSLKRKGINVIRMLTESKDVVLRCSRIEEVKQLLDKFIYDNIAPQEREHVLQTQGVEGENNAWCHYINVFVAGAKALVKERNVVISSLVHLCNNSNENHVFRVKTYEDFGRSLTHDGRQQEYNNYIAKVADCVIFILDETVGGITFDEFRVAMKAYKKHSKPEIYVYSHVPNRSLLNSFLRRRIQSNGIESIRDYLSKIGQYYIEYRDLHDLGNSIAHDFRNYIGFAE